MPPSPTAHIQDELGAVVPYLQLDELHLLSRVLDIRLPVVVGKVAVELDVPWPGHVPPLQRALPQELGHRGLDLIPVPEEHVASAFDRD